MGFASQAAGAAVALLLLGTVLVVLLRGRAESRRQLASARAETAELRARLDELTARVAETPPVPARDEAYVITDAGSAEPPVTVPDRVVLTATVGEPLVKVVAFGHGVRRALSAESRNRIWFEMRREVRRARKQRRRDTREAWRRMQADQRDGQSRTDRSDPAPGAETDAA